ncbi:Uncharacterized protein APZ42_027687 [Daphnia magna]|uniref:Uncharacterized protein n=1 Tax=Daphnia magna TaxID=35525 RepID=A0A162D8M2_9CRUS|nr:Uncharacterized protein APZ42_027687 [Daphnia magna]
MLSGTGTSTLVEIHHPAMLWRYYNSYLASLFGKLSLKAMLPPGGEREKRWDRAIRSESVYLHRALAPPGNWLRKNLFSIILNSVVGVYPDKPQIFFSFQARMSSDSSSDSSSSSRESSETSSSSSSSVLTYPTRKFKVSKGKSTGLSQWIVTGINEEKIKKSSNATKANIDPTEKVLKKLSFKVQDLIKPLLFLAGRSRLRRRRKSDSKAIKDALRLWATLFHDILKSRRHNNLSQVYPKYMGLLDRDDIWSGGEDLFGRKFLKHLVEEAKAQATLEGIAKKKKKIWLPNDHPVASTSQFKKPQNYFNNGPRDGYVTVSPYSFGGRISRYISALPKITGDPWI